MNILLFIFLLASCSVILVMYLVNRRNQRESESRIRGLEEELSVIKIKLDNAAKELVASGESNQFETYASQIVSHLHHGIVYIDQYRTVRLANVYAEKFLDDAPVGKPYSEVLHLQRRGKSDYSLFESALTGKTQAPFDDFEIVTRLGTMPISASVIPLMTEPMRGAVIFSFADNSKNVNLMKEEKAFFSQAAHELRTPLTVIRFTVEVLLAKFDTLGREKIIEHLRRVNETTEHLVKLVNDFLNISRIDQGKIEVVNKPFDMVKLTYEVVQELSPLAKERKLFLNHEPVDGEYRNVIGDRTKAKEVLTNLIGNSIKYTIQGGLTITHKATAAVLATKITDSGSGIPKEQQGMLFKRFTQIGGARLQSSAKSTGLGLYISKKFAQLMRGDVVLEASEPGKGSTFAFILPLG